MFVFNIEYLVSEGVHSQLVENLPEGILALDNHFIYLEKTINNDFRFLINLFFSEDL